MERILNYTITPEGISPAQPLCGGYQGEHRATAAVFTPSSDLSEEIALRKAKGSELYAEISLVTEAGEVFSEDKRNIDGLSEPFFLTRQMTLSGLDSTLILRITETDAEGNRSDFLRGAAPVYFMKGEGFSEETAVKEQVGEVEKKTAEAILLIEGKCAEAEGIVSDGIYRMQTLQAISADQLKKTLSAAEQAETAAEDAAKSAAHCGETADSIAGLTASARQYSIDAAGYRELAVQEAANAESSADRAGELLVQVELYTSRNEEILGQNLSCAESCSNDSAAAEQAAGRAEDFAESARSYSLSAVSDVQTYIDETFGDLGAALDGILALQEGYIGGEAG